MILNNILVYKRKEVEELKRRYPIKLLKKAVEKKIGAHSRHFQKTLSSGHGIRLIAEIKKSSPSEGLILPDFNPVKIAEKYEYAGADALSILTEKIYFEGSASFLKTVRRKTRLPILRKDFIIDPYQLWQSAFYEADAVLLITSILSSEELKFFINELKTLQIDALVEVHSERDLKKALDCGAKLIGVNNRNLQTLTMDKENVERLFPLIPKDVTVVAESGFSNAQELMKLSSLGIHIFLVGTSILKSPDIVQKIRELKGK